MQGSLSDGCGNNPPLCSPLCSWLRLGNGRVPMGAVPLHALKEPSLRSRVSSTSVDRLGIDPLEAPSASRWRGFLFGTRQRLRHFCEWSGWGRSDDRSLALCASARKPPRAQRPGAGLLLCHTFKLMHYRTVAVGCMVGGAPGHVPPRARRVSRRRLSGTGTTPPKRSGSGSRHG